MGDGQGRGLDVQVDNHVGLHNFRFMDHLYELSRDPGQGGFHYGQGHDVLLEQALQSSKKVAVVLGRQSNSFDL